MPSLDDLFNTNKVHRLLAEMLPVGTASITHVDRYSLAVADGIVTQVLNTTARFADDPDVVAYLQIDPADSSIWDPAHPAKLANAVAAVAGAAGLPNYGAVWVRGRDVHPYCRHNDVVAALVLLGRTLFVRATTSAVKRAIRRPDGPDENTYTVLLNQLVRHYDPRLLRFDEDTTRAARDELSSGVLADTCIGRGTRVQFGMGQIWDPQDPMHQQMLKHLLGFGALDDNARRRRLAGKRILKLAAGGAPRSERQLPHGYVHARDAEGNRIQVDGKGYVPEAQSDFVPILQELVRLHAAGASYVDIGRRMAALGAERRGQKQKGVPTLAELMATGDLVALGEAAKSFFINASASPTRDLEMYLQKVHLWRTGVFHTQIENEIRGRGVTIAGLYPIYRGDEDEYGYFDIKVTWPWPLDPKTRTPLEAWGVAKELAESEARLVAEIGRPRATGGAAHRRSTKRAVTPPEWIDKDRVSSVQPRQHNSGRNSCVIFSNTVAAREGRRGWSIERANPRLYATASFPLTDLCGSLASSVERAVREVLDPASLAPVALDRQRTGAAELRLAVEQRIADLEAMREANREEEQARRDDAEAHGLLADRRRENGDEEGAAKTATKQAELTEEADALVAARTRLEVDIATARRELADPAPADAAEASLNVAAYLVAGLRRAQGSNGTGPARLADLVSEHVTEWRMTVLHGAIRWSARLSLPLLDGGLVRINISGVLDDVRSAAGGRSATSGEVLAEKVFVEGRMPDDLALTSGVDTSRRALLVKHLMPWLKAKGVVSRGASCALVDHPVPEAQHLLFEHLTGRSPGAAAAWPAPLRQLIIETYTDSELRWGFAACPDDAATIQRIVSAVAAAGPAGALIDDLALAASWTEREVRELARPYDRAGFTRPRLLELHPDDPARLRVIACTHHRRGERPLADRVVLLPEVAASGFAVLCACGRAPVPRRDPGFDRWHRIAFPAAYTSTLFTRIARSSLRDEPQTGPAGELAPLVLARRAA